MQNLSLRNYGAHSLRLWMCSLPCPYIRILLTNGPLLGETPVLTLSENWKLDLVFSVLVLVLGVKVAKFKPFSSSHLLPRAKWQRKPLADVFASTVALLDAFPIRYQKNHFETWLDSIVSPVELLVTLKARSTLHHDPGGTTRPGSPTLLIALTCCLPHSANSHFHKRYTLCTALTQGLCTFCP